MRPNARGRKEFRRRENGQPPPLAVFHAPFPGEEVELFSDRTEDAVEYESIMHGFALLHAANATD